MATRYQVAISLFAVVCFSKPYDESFLLLVLYLLKA
jgi:hypothetical protein